MTSSDPQADRPVDAFRKGLPVRLRALGIHLGISAAIFAVAMVLIVGTWYPGFHFFVDGGWQGTRIMIAVDLVLGPLLTFVIFNPFKARHLIAFDLTCIGVIQLGALIWAFYAIESQRLVSVNYYEGTFYSMPAAPMRMEKYPLSLLTGLSDQRPPIIYVAPPANDDERARVGLLALMEGLEEYQDPMRFRAFAAHWPEVKAKARNPAKIGGQDARFAAELPGFLAAHGGKAEDYFFFPYEGRNGKCMLAFSQDGALVGAVGCHSI